MFIRESLTNEAVGQVTWIRTGTKGSDGTKTQETPNFLTDMYKKFFPTTAAKSAWNTLITKRKTKSGAASSAKSATPRLSARSAAIGAGIIGSFIALMKNWSPSEDSDAEADEKLSKVFDALENLRIANQDKIQQGFRTPAVINMDDSSNVDTLIASMSENYTKKSNAVVVANKLDDFFTKPDLQSPYHDMESSIDTIIDQNSEGNSQENLKTFVFSYLLSGTANSIMAALSTDVAAIEEKKGALDNSQQTRVTSIIQTIAKIENDPEYQTARDVISSITET
jgi:hypothetical protein